MRPRFDASWLAVAALLGVRAPCWKRYQGTVERALDGKCPQGNPRLLLVFQSRVSILRPVMRLNPNDEDVPMKGYFTRVAAIGKKWTCF